tara:strand:- start:794 stop:1909 length:1116 start_codon:yes stop_codon:yes gene_type:complete
MIVYNLRQKLLSSLILLVFLLPRSITPFVKPEHINTYYLLVLFSFLMLCISYHKIILIKDNSQALNITLVLFLSGCVNFLVKNQLNTFDVIFPLMAFVGYQLTSNKKIDVKFIAYLVFPLLYVIYYYNYYSILPDLFYRPFFNEDCFYGASSNTIPIGLNNTLFCLMILNYLNDSKIDKFLFRISIINILLIVIQQSRAGILVAFILLMICIYLYNYKLVSKFKYFYIFISVFIFLYVTFNLVITMGFSEIQDYSIFSEARTLPSQIFFENLNSSNFFFGYSNDTYFGNFKYTYNVFLEFWNKYNFISFIFLLTFIIYRFINHKKFFFPLFFLVPFLMYAIVESIYLPMFWDFMIYLILFLPKREKNIIVI